MVAESILKLRQSRRVFRSSGMPVNKLLNIIVFAVFFTIFSVFKNEQVDFCYQRKITILFPLIFL